MAQLQAVNWGPATGPARGLVVLCHGVGADGRDLIGLAPQWGAALPHLAFTAPDAPEPYAQAPMGRQWYDLSDRSPARMEAGGPVPGRCWTRSSTLSWRGSALLRTRTR